MIMKNDTQHYAHGGNVYAPSPTGKWLDFSANINPLGLSSAIKQTLTAHLEAVVHYPDPEARALKAALAEHYDLPAHNIIVGNGVAELIYLFFQVVRPHRVLVPVPSFGDYERAATAAHCVVQHILLRPEAGFLPDRKKCQQAASITDCLIIGNPNNPTGTLLTQAELLPLLETMQEGRQWLLVDESFMDFCEERADATLRQLVQAYPYLVVLQSLTKFYAIPGLRLGYAVASRELVQRLEAAKDVWNVNALAQFAGVTALQQPGYEAATRKFLRQEAAYLSTELEHLPGIKVLPGAANFRLVDIHGTGYTSGELTAALRARGVLVRDCANFAGLDDGYLRLAVRTHEENKQLLTHLEAVLA